MGAVALVVVVLFLVAAPTPAHASATPPTPAPPETVVRDQGEQGDQGGADDFYPEQAELSDCIGALERPGCGSSARGGWRQTLVFAAMATGLVLIFARLLYAVRKNRKAST